MIKMGNDIDVDPRGVFRPYLRQQAAAEGAQNKTGARHACSWKFSVAESEGFEPPVAVTLRRFSKPLP